MEDWKGWLAKEREKLLFIENHVKSQIEEVVAAEREAARLRKAKSQRTFSFQLQLPRLKDVKIKEIIEMMRVDTKKPSAVTRSETPPEEGPPTRQTKVRDLHMLMQRFVVAEGSCKNIENRITLLLSSIELLRSIPRKGDQWWERKNHDSQYTQENPSMGRKHPDWGCGITPSTLDRDQRMLEALQLSCQHSEQWSQAYSKRANIQVQLHFNTLTSDIALEAQKDGSAMMTLAVVTTIFLPGTFICSFFGTAFFKGADDTFQMNPLVYVYFLITIPITFAVVLFWWVWGKHRYNRKEEQFKSGKGSV